MEVRYHSNRSIENFNRTLNHDGSINLLNELMDFRESINKKISNIDEFLNDAHKACECAAKDKMIYVKDLENLDNAISKLQS